MRMLSKGKTVQSAPGKQLFSHPFHQRRPRSGRPRQDTKLLGGQALAEAQRLSRPRVRPMVLILVLICADLLVMLIGGLMARLLSYGQLSSDIAVISGLWIGALGLMAVVRMGRGYELWRMRLLSLSLSHLILGLAVGLGAVLFLGLAHDPADQALLLWLGWWAALSGGVLALVRLGLWYRINRLIRLGLLEHRVILLGGGAALAPVIAELQRCRGEGYRICGFFDERDDPRSPPVVAGQHKTGTLQDLVAFARMAQIDSLIVAMPHLSRERLVELMSVLSVLPLEVRGLPTPRLDIPSRARRSRIGQLELVELCRKPMSSFQMAQKRALDLVTASIALILLAPVLLGVALAVRLESRGPVLFRQRRHGFNNQPITILKFRSMYADRCDPTAVSAVRRNDPRVTRVGRLIRRSSLDELPQLFNVLSGKLSMVGPRPHATAARTGDILYDNVSQAYSARHKVKPGITGWAQINGWRGEMNTSEKIRERLRHDLYYIENWSLLFDLWILLRTPAALLRTKNAY